MSSGESGLKKIFTTVLTVIILIVASIFGIDLSIEDDTLGEGKETITFEAEHPSDAEGELILTMIDVGQADSFFFLQDGKTALVDCGTRSTGEDVVKYLKEQGIDRLDYVFGTHPHDDHMGGMYDVVTNFEVGKVIIPEVEAGKVTSNWYLKLMEELSKNSYDVEYVKLGTTYNLGDAIFKVIGPISDGGDNLNNYSTVLKVSFGEMDVIMTGDAEIEVEEEILNSKVNIDAEILKVSHHGSDTSSMDKFIDAISPDYALISTKVGNKYEHPIKSTMDKLKKRKIEVYRTDENGTVVVTITSNDAKFSTNPGSYLSGKEIEERYAK